MSEPQLHPHAYVLAVHDLAGSTAYFRDVLGFEPEWRDGGNWQALRRGQVRVNLGRCPDAAPPAVLGDHNYFGFFSTDDIDRLHGEFVAKGAIVIAKCVAPKQLPEFSQVVASGANQTDSAVLFGPQALDFVG